MNVGPRMYEFLRAYYEATWLKCVYCGFGLVNDDPALCATCAETLDLIPVKKHDKWGTIYLPIGWLIVRREPPA